jgi:hypothetical protein
MLEECTILNGLFAIMLGLIAFSKFSAVSCMEIEEKVESSREKHPLYSIALPLLHLSPEFVIQLALPPAASIERCNEISKKGSFFLLIQFTERMNAGNLTLLQPLRMSRNYYHEFFKKICNKIIILMSF